MPMLTEARPLCVNRRRCCSLYGNHLYAKPPIIHRKVTEYLPTRTRPHTGMIISLSITEGSPLEYGAAHKDTCLEPLDYAPMTLTHQAFGAGDRVSYRSTPKLVEYERNVSSWEVNLTKIALITLCPPPHPDRTLARTGLRYTKNKQIL
ncbi:hypothetical protein HOY82DRAFT_543897 [Tuber indicum]|nr:hypothetical protein HOY82DRAFT_543897 [Tuber indicum]